MLYSEFSFDRKWDRFLSWDVGIEFFGMSAYHKLPSRIPSRIVSLLSEIWTEFLEKIAVHPESQRSGTDSSDCCNSVMVRLPFNRFRYFLYESLEFRFQPFSPIHGRTSGIPNIHPDYSISTLLIEYYHLLSFFIKSFQLNPI